MTEPEFTEKPLLPLEDEKPPFEEKRSSSAFCRSSNLTFFFYGVLLLVTLPLLYWREGTLLPDFVWGKILLYQQILLGFTIGLAFVVLSMLGTSLFESLRRAEEDFRRILGPLSGKKIFFIALCSSVVEELFFRGLLQPWIGLYLTSFVFGLLHLPITKNLRFYPLVAAAMGLVFGWLFLVTGGILAPIIAHFSINSINLYRILKRSSWEENSYFPL